MSRYRHLNRKLIPANIILLVLALVACLTQLFMPLITIKVDLPEGSVADLVRTIAGAQDEDEDSSAGYVYALADETDMDSDQGEELEADTDGDDGTDDTSGGTGDIVTYAVDFLDKIDSYFGYMPGFSFKVSFSPLSLVRNIGKDIDAFAEWFASLFPTEEKMEELAVDVFSPMIAGLVNTEIILMMNGNIINTKFAKLLERTEDDIVAVFTDLAEGNA
ncbi:MAG: hypothetical protein LUD50_02210, partial [Clostridia bacterium]|nr:hypothetical protein [Clostridia bacterium]